MKIAKLWGTPILRNIYEWMVLYQGELFTFHYCNVACFPVLKIHSISDAIFSLIFIFFCYIVIFFVNNKQNILFNLNPCVTKRQHMWKKSFDIFLLYLHNRFFLVLEVLYERSGPTKGASQNILRISERSDADFEVRWDFRITFASVLLIRMIIYVSKQNFLHILFGSTVSS